MWIEDAVNIDVVYAPSNDTDPPGSAYRTVSNIIGISPNNASTTQWVASATPTFLNTNAFRLAGDVTGTLHAGRRVRTTNTGGTIYSVISSATFATSTTVGVINDSGTLDSGLSAAAYGVLSATDPSTPLLTDAYPIISGSADKTKKLRLEVDGLTAATTRVLTVQDEDGTIALTSEFAYSNLAGSSGRMILPPKYIQGMTYSNGSDVTNDIDIAAGSCVDATGAENIVLAAITKQLDATWAVGTGAGGLDTGVIGNSDYYIWAIKRSDTGVTDALFSLSSTAPTMPTNYNYKRLIGWFKRVAGTIVAFTAYETDGGGLELLWNSPTLDVDLSATLTTTQRTDALKVPLNFSTRATFNVANTDAAAGTLIYFSCPDLTDLAPSGTVAPLMSFSDRTAGPTGGLLTIRTSATGTIAARASVATVDVYRVVTVGFTWARRN
jgi:hypothetical protein